MAWRGPDETRAFPSLGDRVVEFVETYLCHGPGDVMGDPIVLDDEFYSFIVRAYRVDPVTGRRVYRRAFLSRAKGRAKSELAGMLVVAEALAPVRFDGWDARGDPVGRPVKSPFIRCLATEEGQSGNTFDNVAVMLAHVVERHGDEFPGIDVGRSAQSSSRILLHAQHGEIVPSTAASASKDGGKETFAVFDETHLYTLPELRRMHDVVRRNLRKRRGAEPWCLETSTMYRPGEESVAESTHSYAQAIAEGRARERGLLFDHREAPAATDLGDRDSLLAGLRVAYGPAAAWLDLDGIVAEIWDPQSDPADSRRYWLNQPAVAEDALVSAAEWDACYLDDVLEPGEEITLGFDGSKNDDSTVLVAMRVRDRFATVIGVQERDDRAPGWEVDREFFDGLVASAFATYRVVGFYADVAHFETYVDKWSTDHGGVLAVKAAAKSAVGWDMRGRLQQLTAATERLVAGIRDGVVRHDGGTVLRRHVLNARRRPNRWGISFGKDRKGSPRKVDGFAACQLADMARADFLAAGVGKRARSGKVW